MGLGSLRAIDIPDTLKIVVISSDDKLRDDLEEDQEFEEHQIDHDVEETVSSVSDNSFDLDEDLKDESNQTTIRLAIISLV